MVAFQDRAVAVPQRQRRDGVNLKGIVVPGYEQEMCGCGFKRVKTNGQCALRFLTRKTWQGGITRNWIVRPVSCAELGKQEPSLPWVIDVVAESRKEKSKLVQRAEQ